MFVELLEGSKAAAQLKGLRLADSPTSESVPRTLLPLKGVLR